MADFDFPRRPVATVEELWQANIDLLPQLRRRVIRNVSIGTSETPIAHGLKYAPQSATLIPQADARWWRTKAPDAKYVYYAASSAVVSDVEIIP